MHSSMLHMFLSKHVMSKVFSRNMYLPCTWHIQESRLWKRIDTYTVLHLCPALARHLVACRAAAGCGLPSRHQRGALSPQGSQQAQLRHGWSLPPGTKKVCRLRLIPFHTLGALANKSFFHDNLSLTNRYKVARSSGYHLCMLHYVSTLCHNVALQST